LYKNKIVIPVAICEAFSEKRRGFYSSASGDDIIKLIYLGFTVHINRSNHYRSAYLRIKDCEKLFTEAKQQQFFNKKLNLQQLISLMKTPEELSLFLSYFSDYDLNSIDADSGHNVLDQIIHMNPYFYLKPESTNNTSHNVHRFRRQRAITPSNTSKSKLDSRPNDRYKYRTTRLLNLFQSVILQGGKVCFILLLLIKDLLAFTTAFS
jgi:hypothetical protein